MKIGVQFSIGLLIFLQVGDMSSDFKLDAVKGHDSEDPEVGPLNGVHTILPERRATTLSDRQSHLLPTLHFKI